MKAAGDGKIVMLIITDRKPMESPEATQLTSTDASLFIAGELRKATKAGGKLAELEVKEQRVIKFRKTGKLVSYRDVSPSCTSYLTSHCVNFTIS